MNANFYASLLEFLGDVFSIFMPAILIVILAGGLLLVWLFGKLSITSRKMALIVFGQGIAALYLLVFGFLALVLIFVGWPGGAISNALFGPKNYKKAMELTLLERQQTLDQLSVMVNRTLKSASHEFTGQDRNFYDSHKTVINQLLGKNSTVFQANGMQASSVLWSVRTSIDEVNKRTTVALGKLHSDYLPGNELNDLMAGLSGAELAAYNEKVAALKKDDPIYLLDSRDLAVVIVMLGFGALGASIQGLSSVAIYVGLKKFKLSWLLFYFSRPYVGGGVALGFYFVMQGGVAGGTTPTADGSIIGPSAVSLLVGLFSGEAMEKLRDVAGSLFKSNKSGDAKEDNDTVSITGVKFESVAGDPVTYNVFLFGKNFSADCVLLIDKKTWDFELVAPDQIKVKGVDQKLIEATRPLSFNLVDIKKDGAILAHYQELKAFVKPVEDNAVAGK